MRGTTSVPEDWEVEPGVLELKDYLQTTAQTLDEQLADPSHVQSYHTPCEPALMGLTAGCPLRSWAA